MRRVSAASLATINPMARTGRDATAKDGDVTAMFADTIQVPACVLPAVEPAPPPPAAEPQPAPAEVKPAAAVPALAVPVPAMPAVGAGPSRPTWHERMARAISARFRRPPREGDGETGETTERLDRFRSRRSGSGSPL